MLVPSTHANFGTVVRRDWGEATGCPSLFKPGEAGVLGGLQVSVMIRGPSSAGERKTKCL